MGTVRAAAAPGVLHSAFFTYDFKASLFGAFKNIKASHLDDRTACSGVAKYLREYDFKK
jgi:putative aminopeptidase FrvX